MTPFLPGDSLLFATGALAALGKLNLPLLAGCYVAAATLGDAVNYASAWLAIYAGHSLALLLALPLALLLAPLLALPSSTRRRRRRFCRCVCRAAARRRALPLRQALRGPTHVHSRRPTSAAPAHPTPQSATRWVPRPWAPGC